MPILIIASIWLPVVRYYHVPDARITPADVTRTRWSPPQSVLQEIRGDRLLRHGWRTRPELITAAEHLLQGELRLRGQPRVKYHVPFHPENLTVGTSLTQVYVAGMVPADLLLQAYEASGNERFYSAALAAVLEFARYERRAVLPKGLLWNDHAIANRVFVLSDFWAVYRRRPEFEAATATVILDLVSRSGELLAAPAQFTFATNHGIMQNIALLRLSLSFPALPKAREYARLAVDRLDDQLRYYISPEGVVLEHSAGYQYFGIELLGLATRYVQLSGIRVPDEWERKYSRAVEFAAQLRRPDGTLPLYGDTGWNTRLPRENSARPPLPVGWYPTSGYAVWWDGLDHWPDAAYARQTVVTYSYFPGHAHKHADELSVLLWAGGQIWWTNVGYWPYDRPERRQAESWNGSSAPHLLGEPTDSRRVTGELSRGSSRETVFVDVARDGPDGYRVRRQVVYVRPNNWLIIDAVSGAPTRASVTRWTAGPQVTVHDREAGSYVMQSPNKAMRLFVSYFGSPGTTVRSLTNTLGPFLGYGGNLGAAVAGIEVTQPADDSWSATAWLFDPNGTVSPVIQPKMEVWRGPEDWSALLPSGQGFLRINRLGDRVTVSLGKQIGEMVTLKDESAGLARREIAHAFQRTAGTYPRFSVRVQQRQWASYALIGVIATQELFLLAIAQWGQKFYRWCHSLTVPLWIVGSLLLAEFLRR
jgi:hypothetical protein